MGMLVGVLSDDVSIFTSMMKYGKVGIQIEGNRFALRLGKNIDSPVFS
jgi:hypothetical protein